jgi:hypothetical protein
MTAARQDERGERGDRKAGRDTDERSEKPKPPRLNAPAPPPICKPGSMCLPTPVCPRPKEPRKGPAVAIACFVPSSPATAAKPVVQKPALYEARSRHVSHGRNG